MLSSPGMPDTAREFERLQRLRDYHILDTAPEDAFDDLTHLAAFICSTPIALITLLDAKRQWFKSRVGLSAPETPREYAFCNHAIEHPGELFIVPDSHEDVRFSQNPLVTGDPHVRFYAGSPLVTDDGYALGALCVIDREPRTITKAQEEALAALSRQVISVMEMRANVSALQTTVGEVKRTQEMLRKSEERYRHIVDHANDVIYRTDSYGNFTFFNASAIKTMRFEGRQLLGRSYLELVRPDQRDHTRRFYALQAARKQLTSYHEFPALRGDGSEVWLGQNVQLIVESGPKGSDGTSGEKVIGFQALARDVTEYRQSKTDLARSRDEAVQSARMKSAFLANMSHEIRTPMNGIVGLTDLMLEGDLNEEQRSHAETVKQCARSLLTIINDILDFSKIEADRIELEDIPFSIEQTIQGIVNLLRAQAAAKHLRLEALIQRDITDTVQGDPYRLRQILMNLASNAVKFTERGVVEIKVSQRENESGASVTRFEVCDSGIGIALDQQVLLFDAFTQADASTTRKYGGTGLGLSISKRLVGLMDGEIGVESVVGSGSTFWFELPLKFATAALRAEELSPALQHVPESMRILIAEDNQVNQRVAIGHLKKLGYVVDVVNDGLEAINALIQTKYDVVLMDCHMPHMDGFEATREIRRREVDPDARMYKRHTPIIALTANAMQGVKEKCLDAGMDGYITKPIEADELKSALLLAAQKSLAWMRSQEEVAAAVSVADGDAAASEAAPVVGDAVGDAARGGKEKSVSASAARGESKAARSRPVERVLDSMIIASLRDLNVEGEDDLLAELVELFVNELPTRLTALTEAIEQGDAAKISHITHTIKGSSSNLGAVQLAKFASDLEVLARDCRLSDITEKLEEFEVTAERAMAALQREVVGVV